MSDRPIVLQRDRHLKWRALDPLEWLLMVLCGICIAGFSLSVFFDIVTRTLRHPWLWLQEVTMLFFAYGSFFGMAVATRRMDHLYLSALTESFHGTARSLIETFNRLVVLACGLLMLTYGYTNFLHGFGSFRMPSLTPLAWWYLSVPVSGFFICLFSIEQIINGWRNGFEGEIRSDLEKEFTI